MLSLHKNNSFLSFQSSIFHSKINKHSACKMNRDEQGEQVKNLKFWVNILSEWSQCLFAATKIYILIFNLTHFLISLMSSFYFSQWKIFFPIHWQILKILGNGVSQSFMSSLKCDHTLLCEFPILFSTVKPKLGPKFSQLMHRFNIWILKCFSGAIYISKFFPLHKRWEIGVFEKPRLYFQIFPNSLNSLKTEIFVPLPLHISG